MQGWKDKTVSASVSRNPSSVFRYAAARGRLRPNRTGMRPLRGRGGGMSGSAVFLPRPRLPPGALSGLPWPALWSAVDACLRTARMRVSTRRVYRQALRTFRAEQDRRHPDLIPTQPGMVTRDHIRAFLVGLTERHYAWSSIATHIGVLRTVFDKLGGEQMTRELRTPKRPWRIPETLTRDEVARLYRAVASNRDRLVIGLLYSGLKPGECCRLRARDIHSDGGQVVVRLPESPGGRVVVVASEVRLMLAAETRFLPPESPLFPGAAGRPITVRTIQRVVNRAVRSAGLSKFVTPMTLRHSFAVQSLRDGMSPRELQQILGHQWLETTLDYRRAIIPSHVVSPADRLFFQPAEPHRPTSYSYRSQFTRGP